tara:strand:- start:349 stop:492 length:144 start_codon:yes stop_codon:yes gene_type:complete
MKISTQYLEKQLFDIWLEKQVFWELYGVDIMSPAIEILQEYEGGRGR